MMLLEKRLDLQSTGLTIGSLIGVASLIAMPTEPQFYVLCATCVSVAGGLVLQLIRNHSEERRYQRELEERKEYRAQLKAEVADVVTNTNQAAQNLHKHLKRNSEQVTQFAETANHVNDKIITIAAAAGVVVPPSLQAVEQAEDTNATVHRIEDKVS